MAPMSSTVARWELKLRLNRLRGESGFDDADIIAAVGISRPYWSQVSNGTRILTEDKLRALLNIYGCDEAEQDELLALRAVLKERGWWMKYPALLSPEMQRLFGLEHGARSIRCYNSLLIPGLLQSRGYARAIIAANTMIRPFEVDQHLAIRMQRQHRLAGDDPLHLTAVFSQAALIQQTGGPDVLREQLHHLVRLIEDHPDTIEIRVIPFTAAEGAALGGSTYHLLDFPSTHLPTVEWSETALQGNIIEDQSEVNGLSYAFRQALTHTLSADDSLALIKASVSG
ncbi:helix-turn-helix domain-containing protein [Nocardia uniformis]|uniref:Helix-turn-helix domain-containing protein n=1 Tax=Nocardia uniformis TaxID=53432 RepID=A0A849C854_9NOCA|nr:helix-turn-helix transcriptional regulator [Nocardia uniformis]NNH72475.1 helix-turn-helix domain-containing protein [Nocardia uniformis]